MRHPCLGQSVSLSHPRGPQIPKCLCLSASNPLRVCSSHPLSMPPHPTPAHGLLPLAETLASAKEENVEIHQTLDQTLLELNNL